MNLSGYVETLALFSDESRLRLCALLRRRELSVGELVRVTGLSQSRVSTHLARLREGGIVRDRREGQQAFYALVVDAMAAPLRAVLEEAMGAEDPTLEGDRRRLAELDEAPGEGLLFAPEVGRQYTPGRTWQSLAVGLSGLLRLGDVLDVGAGDGAVASYVAPYCRSLTCVDAAPRAVEAARGRLGGHRHVTVQQADAEELPFPGGSFDEVLLFHTLVYVERPQRVVEQCARVLRPGGRLVALSLDEHEHGELTAGYGEVHAGFSARRLRGYLARARLDVVFCGVACRETRKPHFQNVLAVAERPVNMTQDKRETR